MNQDNQANQENQDAVSLGKTMRGPTEVDEEGEYTGVNVPEEGEEREDTRKCVIPENEVNTQYLSGEGIMESV